MTRCRCPRRCSRRICNWTARWTAVTGPNRSPATGTASNTSSPSTSNSPPRWSPPGGPGRGGSAKGHNVDLNLWAYSSGRLLRPVHPQQLSRQHGLPGDGLMNPLGLSVEVRVELANDDPGMCRLVQVKPDEMQTIQGQHRSLLACGKGQHFLVRQGLVSLAGFLNSQHVVAQRPQLFDDRHWEILVGIEPRH